MTSIPADCRRDVEKEAHAARKEALARGRSITESYAVFDAVIARYATLADNAAAASRAATAAMDPDQPEASLKGENDRLRITVARLTKDNTAYQVAIVNAIGALPKSKRLAETFLVNALHVTKGNQ